MLNQSLLPGSGYTSVYELTRRLTTETPTPAFLSMASACPLHCASVCALRLWYDSIEGTCDRDAFRSERQLCIDMVIAEQSGRQLTSAVLCRVAGYPRPSPAFRHSTGAPVLWWPVPMLANPTLIVRQQRPPSSSCSAKA